MAADKVITNLDQAQSLAARGWYVFPCHEKPWDFRKNGEVINRKAKEPYWHKDDLPHGKDNASIDPEQITIWWNRWPGALIGIYCEKSGIFALDIDKKEKDGWQSLFDLLDKHNAASLLPVTGPAQNTPSGGAHYIYKLTAAVKIPNNAGILADGLDLRSNGYICTGGAYNWISEHGPELPVTEAPAWLIEEITNIGQKSQQRPRQDLPRNNGYKSNDRGEYWLRKALDLASEGSRNDRGFWLASQLRDADYTESEAKAYMQRYAESVPGTGYTVTEALKTLESAYKLPKRQEARKNGSQATTPTYGQENQSSQATPGAYKLDDIGNGERLANRHGGRLRYVKEWGWMVYNGQVWENDRGQAAQLAKETARSVYIEAAACEDDNIRNSIAAWAKASASENKRAAMLSAAASEPGIIAAPKQFDLNPWLLNCDNGILDLRTGILGTHKADLLLTKKAGTAYKPDATCPTWLSFLSRIFAGNKQLINFLQRAAGYTLTGNITEQKLFFLYGTGSNGKSTFTEAMQAILGDYARKTPTETLMQKYQDNGGANPDLARLAGARMVSAAELADGRRLNEPLIKDMTGGDRITARYLHREYFEFSPTFKLWMYGNHQPVIRGTDPGIWRRVLLIPFTVSIPEAEQDKTLSEKLLKELPGILAWAVNGCLAWQREGLQIPLEVITATADYKASQDILALFFSECCVLNSLASVKARDLYNAFKAWALETNVDLVSEVIFSKRMTEKGFTKSANTGSGKAYLGIGLMQNEQ